MKKNEETENGRATKAPPLPRDSNSGKLGTEKKGLTPESILRGQKKKECAYDELSIEWQ